MSKINFKKILKETPLDIRIDVENEVVFINLLTELGYRENKPWTPDEDAVLAKLVKSSKLHTENILKTFKEWQSDGCPQKK